MSLPIPGGCSRVGRKQTDDALYKTDKKSKMSARRRHFSFEGQLATKSKGEIISTNSYLASQVPKDLKSKQKTL